jgi:hypothetical protein
MTDPKCIHDVEGLNAHLQEITRRARIDLRYLHDDRAHVTLSDGARASKQRRQQSEVGHPRGTTARRGGTGGHQRLNSITSRSC